jgi:hypothetical protein
MNSEELDRALDEWLDRAAAAYGTAETRPGFEARVISNVNSRLEKRRWHFRRLSLAIAATAVIIVACYVFLARLQEHPAIDTALDRPQKPRPDFLDRAPGEQILSTMQAAVSKKKNAARSAPPKPRKTPEKHFLSAGLSDQERYLISFVQTVSAQTSTDASEAESGPLQMPDFEIPTIQIPKEQVSFINIDMVQLPIAHQSEDPL